MKVYEISLSSIAEIKQFINYICKYDCDFDLRQGRYCINAKNIMGVMALELMETVELVIWEDEAERIMNEMLEEMDFL